MKRPTHEAAKSLGLHPANLVLYLSCLGAPFEDCWPEVDEGWLETLRGTYWHLFEEKQKMHGAEQSPDLHGTAAKKEVSVSAMKVLDKLQRKKHWGTHTISWDTLHNHYCSGLHDLEDAVNDLQKRELLLGSGIEDRLSLNPAKKREIDLLVEEFRKTH
jgi:hypothetical protein